ncbi:MAG: ATP synthase F1 subunit delta [Candidatus Omnitrophota bacterium]
MIEEELCAKYAHALLETALSSGEGLHKVSLDIGLFTNILRRYPALLRIWAHPGIPLRKKERLLEGIISYNWFSSCAERFLRLLLRRRSLGAVASIYRIYSDLSLMLDDRLEVVVESAVSLGEDIRRELGRRLSGVYGKDMDMRIRVRPDLLAGLKARVGDTVYDFSLKRQLQRLREEMEVI